MNQSKEFALNKIEPFIILITAVFMITVSFFTVVSRYIFDYTLPWAEQAVRLAMIYMFFAGMSQAAKVDLHYKVTVMTLVFRKPKALKRLYLFGDIVMILFGIYMGYQCGMVTMKMIESGAVLPSMPWCPKWVQYLPGCLGMLGVSVRTFQRCLWTRGDGIQNIEKEDGEA